MTSAYDELEPRPEYAVSFERFANRVAAHLVNALDLTFEQADGVRPMTPAELLTLTAPLRRDDR